MKRIVALLMVGVLLFSISGCSKEEKFVDRESVFFESEKFTSEQQSQIRKDYLEYLQTTHPENEKIQKLTVNDILLISAEGTYDEADLYIMDWYGSTHSQHKTRIEIDGVSLKFTFDYIDMMFFYKNGEFRSIYEALEQNWFSQETQKVLREDIAKGHSDWRYDFYDGRIVVGLTAEATERYTDISSEGLSKLLETEILSVEDVFMGDDYDDITHKPTGKYNRGLILSVPQRGRRELYSVIHILKKHIYVKYVYLNSIARLD